MLTRISIHNFRSFINFSQELDAHSLLLGYNGTGKSTLFDVLHNIKLLVLSVESLRTIFTWQDLPVWLNEARPKQTFALEVVGNQGTYVYRLVVEFEAESKACRVYEESLTYNDKLLFSFHQGKVQLFRDDFTPGPSFPVDWNRSGLGLVVAGQDNTRLIWFRNWLSRLIVSRLSPKLISGQAEREETFIQRDMENFANWLLYLTIYKPRQVRLLENKLREIMPGFEILAFEPHGNVKLLYAEFSHRDRIIKLKFDQLSEGQKALIVFYTLLCSVGEDWATLCLDEPDNYLMLPEVQPMLFELLRLTEENRCQALLISHHPRVINLNEGSNYWFSRGDNGQGFTRCHKIQEDKQGMSLAQWIEAKLMGDGEP